MFVGVDEEIDGMVHMTDVSWDNNDSSEFKKGDVIKVKVLDVDAEKERISLGIKQLNDDPYAAAAEGLKKGTVVTGTVTEVHDKGIEVALESGLTGSIKKADLSRERSEQRSDRFAVGEKVDAMVLSMDRSGRKANLSIKARELDEEKQAMSEFGSADSGASLGDILGDAMNKAKKTTKSKKAE